MEHEWEWCVPARFNFLRSRCPSPLPSALSAGWSRRFQDHSGWQNQKTERAHALNPVTGQPADPKHPHWAVVGIRHTHSLFEDSKIVRLSIYRSCYSKHKKISGYRNIMYLKTPSIWSQHSNTPWQSFSSRRSYYLWRR